MTKKISLALVEDHEMVRQMWRMLFESRPEIEVVGEAGLLSEALPMIGEKQPDIVLLDINLPDGSGIQAVPGILKLATATAIIVVSMHNQPSYARKMFDLGAKGYVTKDTAPEEIFLAIDAVTRGEVYVGQEVR